MYDKRPNAAQMLTIEPTTSGDTWVTIERQGGAANVRVLVDGKGLRQSAAITLQDGDA